MPTKKHDPVNHPSHYTDGNIEVIDYIEDKRFGYCLGNAIKYISRAGKKEPDNPNKEIEDLKKAVWYINRRIRELEGDAAIVAGGESTDKPNVVAGLEINLKAGE